MQLFALLSTFLILPVCAVADSTTTISTVQKLTEVLDTRQIGRPFDITARANTDSRPLCALAVEDETGANFIEMVDQRNIQHIETKVLSGDRIRVSGYTQIYKYRHIKAYVTNITVLAHGHTPKPTDVTPGEFLGRTDVGRYLRLTGTLHDTFRDDVDSKTEVLILDCENETVCAFFLHRTDTTKDTFRNLIGARIAISGISNVAHYDGYRRFYGRYLSLQSESEIEVLSPPPRDPYQVPLLDREYDLSAQEISRLGRRRAIGHVLATWNNSRFLLKTASENLVRIELVGGSLPDIGEQVEAIGFPETDLFHLNLVRAQWRSTTGKQHPIAMAANRATIYSILHNNSKNPRINTQYHGQLIKLTGTVRNLQMADNASGSFRLDDGDLTVLINASTVPGSLSEFMRNCKVSVTGVCIFDTETWRPNAVIPHINGFQIVIRTPNDIVILTHPPWWTPGKFIALIGTLMAGLAGILAWNVALRRTATRKGHELMREQIGHVEAQLKTEERTRLAIELHDSLAQNLTGVSLEIDTATKVADEDSAAMKEHLGIAARSLKSCRDELRNCLWDLRNRALETRTMDEAIRQTLAPHVVGVDLAIRFSVPRERISDNTAHAILRIVRELTLNAIRHGGASKIWIAGNIDGGQMRFSVRDNGCGFDPSAAPGFAQGHYGLLGIQERVNEFGGEFALVSSSDKGTKATVSLSIPQETQPEIQCKAPTTQKSRS